MGMEILSHGDQVLMCPPGELRVGIHYALYTKDQKEISKGRLERVDLRDFFEGTYVARVTTLTPLTLCRGITEARDVVQWSWVMSAVPGLSIAQLVSAQSAMLWFHARFSDVRCRVPDAAMELVGMERET